MVVLLVWFPSGKICLVSWYSSVALGNFCNLVPLDALDELHGGKLFSEQLDKKSLVVVFFVALEDLPQLRKVGLVAHEAR